ncbi:MAG: phosphotransferase [Proteobacteria bacterium]|nr:phosphotransferase [Pseudomonadota bacterium]MBU1714145.1 phosphotransferase [Pseudomonadota bacterium]
MIKPHQDQYLGLISLLAGRQNTANAEHWRTVCLAGDGSDRQFYRATSDYSGSCLVIFPSLTHSRGVAEAVAAYRIGSHLRAAGVPVPEILAFDPVSSAIVFEDLGDCHLHDRVQKLTVQSPEVMPLYKEAIEILVHMQVAGRSGFDAGVCWDTPRYDYELMLARESGYFKQAFCQDLLGIDSFDPGLDREFEQLAARAADLPAKYFLHRDFQSRNLMIHQGKIRVIDFQGARLGPLGYDLASLLIDPYVRLSRDQQDELLSFYGLLIESQVDMEQKNFLAGYYLLALQRNLQILGAFAYLSARKGKVFFGDFIRPALGALVVNLNRLPESDFICLRKLLDEVSELYTLKLTGF